MSRNALSKIMPCSASAWFSVNTLPLLVMPSSMLPSIARKCWADERALKNNTMARVTPPMMLDTISIVRMNLLRSEPRGAGGA